MRRSRRFTGYEQEDKSDLQKLISLRNTRRGLIGRLTRIINMIYQSLSEEDVQHGTKLHHDLLECYHKFKAINNEYLRYETDASRLQENEMVEQREARRLAEVEKLIRSQINEDVPEEASQTSFLNVNPSDSASNGGDDHSSLPSHESHFSPNNSLADWGNFDSHGQNNVRFAPKPPSVKSSMRSGLKHFRRVAPTCDEEILSNWSHNSPKQ